MATVTPGTGRPPRSRTQPEMLAYALLPVSCASVRTFSFFGTADVRGTHGYPKGRAYSTVPQGLLLRPAIPSAEVFGVESTYACSLAIVSRILRTEIARLDACGD